MSRIDRHLCSQICPPPSPASSMREAIEHNCRPHASFRKPVLFMPWPVSSPPPSFFLQRNESYLCGLPKRSLPPSGFSIAARKVFEGHSVHVVICICVPWSPFVWGALLILCLAIAYSPTPVSAPRNSSKSSLQLGRLSTKYAKSILYFLALIIIIIEYLYNYWFDAGFSHSLVNSLRAGIMPAWLTILSPVPLITSICQLDVEWTGWTEAVAYAMCICTYVWR